MNLAQFVWHTAATWLVLFPVGGSPGPQSEVVSKKEFENGQILIERTIIPPGFRGEMHTHEAASLEIFITDDHIQEMFPDGSVKEWHAKAGELACIEPVAHAVRNMRNAPTEIISIEFKGAPMKSCPKVDPQAVRAGVDFENEVVRITRGRLAPGQKGGMHSHPHYVGIFLTDAKLRVALADGSTREINGKRGDVSKRDPVTHSIENLADAPFEAIDINLKTPASTEADSPVLQRVSVNGGDLAYMEGGAGEPVVLVHGSLSDYRASLPLMQQLERNLHVINYSRRCHVPNPCPPGSPFSYELHADDLAALIRKLNLGPVHVVGHSYGGAVAILFAQKHPELVRSLVLVEPGMYSLLPQNDETRLWQQQRAALGERVRQALASDLDEEAIRQLVDFVLRPKKFAELPAEYRTMLMKNAPSLRASVAAAAPRPEFTCEDARKRAMPVLLLEGEQTAREFRWVNDELARCVAGAQRIRIPGVDHRLYSEAAEAVGSAISQFLQSLKPVKPTA